MNERQPTRRELSQRRIAIATRGLAVAAAVATAGFVAAAAHTTKARSDDSSARGDSLLARGGDDDWDSGTLTPSQADPQPSFGPAVAASGGS